MKAVYAFQYGSIELDRNPLIHPHINQTGLWRWEWLKRVRRRKWEESKWDGGGVCILTSQLEDWFRLAAGPSAHSAASALLDCLLRSYSFSYVGDKSLERQRKKKRGRASRSHLARRVNPQSFLDGGQDARQNRQNHPATGDDRRVRRPEAVIRIHSFIQNAPGDGWRSDDSLPPSIKGDRKGKK